MSAEARRLEWLEHALTPLEAVFAWLGEARAYRDFGAYVRSVVDVGSADMPLPRIRSRVEAAARERHRREPSPTQAGRVRTAKRDAVFLYMLVREIDAAAHGFATDHAIRLRFSNYLLVEDLDKLFLEGDTASAELLEIWGNSVDQLHPGLSSLLDLAAVERGARTMLVDRYLGGQSPLFDATAEACTDMEQQVEIATGSVEEALMRRPSEARSSDAASIEDRARTRARSIFDDARLAAYDYLGERGAAQEIIRAHLRRPPLEVR